MFLSQAHIYFFSKVGVDSQVTPNIIKHALWFPILVSVFLAATLLYGAAILQITRKEVFDIRDALDLDSAPEFNVLAVLLILSSIMMLIVIVGLGYLIHKY